MIEILIVEDEKPISDLIRLNLMKAGYGCTCAFDGMEAADILEERNFDLIILDVMLPKLNGFELMEYIKPLGSLAISAASSSVNSKIDLYFSAIMPIFNGRSSILGALYKNVRVFSF